MHLIALLIGLVIERLATQLFHLRRLRWIDRVIDAGFRQAGRLSNWPALIPIVALVVLLVVPVLALTVVLVLRDPLLGFPYLILGVFVLFFSLGPQDIGEDVDEYCKAMEDDDKERIRETARAIIESDVPEDTLERIHRVEEAVCVQANNRLFAVIFWFVLLGPLGAWTYRATDLIRRRAVFVTTREDESSGMPERLRDAAIVLHGWLAWIPARLTAIGYAAAGNFDTALGAWRAPTEQESDSASEYNEHLLARVGVGALALGDDSDEDLVTRGVRGATAANRLVFRLLLISAVVVAAMTLYGWTQ
ncbi:MAG: regulatory signaling modulator protein AmpE [Woeseiaceae bacterium]|nr:regulatory signaling modulator protein AmpE [Woeseiaceae bacterium]